MTLAMNALAMLVALPNPEDDQMVELATILDDMPVGEPATATLKAEARHLNFHYGHSTP